MKELIREHYVYATGGRRKKVRILKEPGDVYEGVSRILKKPLILFTDKEWQFTVEKVLGPERDGMLFYKATAAADEEEFNYDFAVAEENAELIQRFCDTIASLTNTEVFVYETFSDEDEEEE